MKQHITVEQLNELSDKAKERLRKWWKAKLGDVLVEVWYEEDKQGMQFGKVWVWSEFHQKQRDRIEKGEKPDLNDGIYVYGENLPLLSIGQMIDFLDWGDMQFYQISSNGQRVPSGWNGKHKNEWCVQNGDYENASVSFYGDELCDALWSACLEILNSKE